MLSLCILVGGSALAVLTGLDGIAGVERHQEGVLLELGDAPAAAAVAALVGAGVAVNRVMPQRRLEDAFLALIAGGSPNGEVTAGAEVADVTPREPERTR